MTMVTGAARRQETLQGLRPFNPTRDLDGVADLLRIAFRDELGRRETAWLQEMQMLGAFTPVIWLLNQVNIAIGRLLHGFVWIEDDRIVGNVTISRLSPEKWLISNVAVHPDYRRRGIGRDLMDASVDWIREKHARWVTLEVRRDNEPAKSLYLDMGFVVAEGTTELERHGAISVERAPVPDGYRLRPARPDDGFEIFELAREATPSLTQRIEPLQRHDYEVGYLSGLLSGVRRLIGLPVTARWVVVDTDETIMASVTVEIGGYSHKLRFLIHPDLRGVLDEAMVTRALDALSGRGGTIRVKVDAEYRETISILGDHGFREVRTLDRMALELNRPRRIPIRMERNRK